MSGLFDRLALRVVGDPPGLARPRVPTRFEPLPEEVGFAAPQPGAVADEISPLPDPPAVSPAIAPPPAAASLLPKAADTVHASLVTATHDVPPAARSADIAGAALAAITASVPPAGQAAAIQRRAADAAVVPGSGTAPAPVTATPSSAVNPDAGTQPPRVPAAASPPIAAPRSTSGNERMVAPDVALRTPVREPAPTRAGAIPSGRANPAVPTAPRAEARAPHAPDSAGTTQVPVVSGTDPKPVEVARTEAVSVEGGSRPATSGAPGPVTHRAPHAASTPTAVPRVPLPATVAPVVEVHIGSVEIRAAPQPALPPAPPGPAARSLDDFLAGRRGR